MNEPENNKTSNRSNPGKGAATGGTVGAVKNAARYVVKMGGTRHYNVVQVLDKTAKTAKGYPKWFARVDLPSRNNPIAHINVNKAVTGVKDPHIPLSTATAQTAGTAGTALNAINKVAPVLTAVAVAYDAYQIKCNVDEDKKNGTTRNTTKKVVTTAATWSGGYGGAGVGAAIGTSFFPGIGTMIGGIVGGIMGGISGSVASDYAADVAMDAYGYNITYPECKKCNKKFECRVFETGDQQFCEDCRGIKRCKYCGLTLETKQEIDFKMCLECQDTEKFKEKEKLMIVPRGNGICGYCKDPFEIKNPDEQDDIHFDFCQECIDNLHIELIEPEPELEPESKPEPKPEPQTETNCEWCGSKFECHGFEKKMVEKLCNSCLDLQKESIKMVKDTCEWCGNELESHSPEGKSQKMCKSCKEILQIAAMNKLKEPEIEKCKGCGLKFKLHKTGTSEKNKVQDLCKLCEENHENELLELHSSQQEQSNQNTCNLCKKTLTNHFCTECQEKVSCKWCGENFVCKKTDAEKDFCPECDAQRPKKK